MRKIVLEVLAALFSLKRFESKCRFTIWSFAISHINLHMLGLLKLTDIIQTGGGFGMALQYNLVGYYLQKI